MKKQVKIYLSLRILFIVIVVGICMFDYAWQLYLHGWGTLTSFQRMNIVLAAFGALIFPLIIGQQLFVRFKRGSYVGFDEEGFYDGMSQAKLGSVKWSAIRDVVVTRTILGAKLFVLFKAETGRLDANRRLSNELLMGPLAISRGQKRTIEELLEAAAKP